MYVVDRVDHYFTQPIHHRSLVSQGSEKLENLEIWLN
jgi:hypothetical protein